MGAMIYIGLNRVYKNNTTIAQAITSNLSKSGAKYNNKTQYMHRKSNNTTA